MLAQLGTVFLFYFLTAVTSIWRNVLGRLTSEAVTSSPTVSVLSHQRILSLDEDSDGSWASLP